MTPLAAPGLTVTPVGTPPGPPTGPAVTALAVRQVRRGALVVAAVTAGMSALVAVQYRSLVAGPVDVEAMRALAENPAIRTLFGEPVGLGTAGGFTVWRTGTVLAVLVGAWAALTATRVTRGEESAGRWTLLLAGQTRLPALVARHLAVLVAAQLVVGAAVATALALAGTGLTGSALYGATLAGVGVVLAATGALAAQLAPERRTASALAVGLLLAWLLLRMVADGVEWLGWAMWLTPFGLLAEAAPYVGDRAAPLGVLAVAATGLSAAAVVGGGRRDVGGGLLPARGARPPRTALLGSLPAFALHRSLPVAAGWAAGLAAYFLLIGLLTVSMTEFLAENPAFADAAAAAGFAELGSVEGYAAALLGLLPVPVGVFAASRIAADAADEADRRLALLLAAPVSRRRFALTSAAVAAALSAGLLAVAGVAVWAGAALVSAPLGLADALTGAVNALPTALLGLGAALLALGWAPRAVLAVGALPVAGGFLLHALADTLAWPGWVRWLSPYAHTAAVPAAGVDWPGAAGLLTVAVALGVAGLVGYERRDLRG